MYYAAHYPLNNIVGYIYEVGCFVGVLRLSLQWQGVVLEILDTYVVDRK